MGWWIRKDGRIYPNEDHFEFVKANAKLFGLTPKFAAGLGLAQREATLSEVIKEGWIRVRGDRRQGITFEVPSLSESVLFNIKDFLAKTKWDPDAKVLVDEVTGISSQPMYESARFFLTDSALAVARNPRRGRHGKQKARHLGRA